MFLFQVLSTDGSCREAVRQFLVWIAMENCTASQNTSAYTKARQRLRLPDLEEVNDSLIEQLNDMRQPEDLWMGRDVKVFDGSSLSMPDTEELQVLYPQPKSQKKGCGFSTMRIMAAFSLATGALITLTRSALSIGENTLFRNMWDILNPGDVVLADRYFCNYTNFFYLEQHYVDCVMRNHQRRTVGLDLIETISKNDRIIAWHKNSTCPKWLEKEEWIKLPNRLIVREITITVKRQGFRTKKIILATTLLDPILYPAADIAALYLQRWNAELYLRDIKVSMGMNPLRCKSPGMVHKELQMYVIAYNLIRIIMFEAAQLDGISWRILSFKGTIATIIHWTPIMLISSSAQAEQLYRLMLSYIARDKLPQRPGRREPRAIKRRQGRGYSLLTKPRTQFSELSHKSQYRKA
ncbi:MAG: IS4 family transposase [Candidatus Aegiribacteria sp.]|nr:IS4 family transposase [Candidatus Aegiribacteria sp.]